MEARIVSDNEERISSRLGGWRGVMNLVLGKRERVTTGGKGRGEIRGKSGKVTGMTADAAYQKWSGEKVWWMAAVEVEILLVMGLICTKSGHKS